MKFLTKTNENDFFAALEKSMEKTASFEENLATDRIDKVRNLLAHAEELLNDAGLDKMAQHVAVVKKVMDKDKSPEHYVQNLLQSGIMQDLTCADDSSADDAQLSSDEIKKLKKLLKTEEEEHEEAETEEEEAEEEKAEDESDENDVKAKMTTPSGEVDLEMTPEEAKQVMSSRKKMLDELSKIL